MSRDLNSFSGHGRFTRDPELRYAQNGTAVASFGVAIGNDYVGKDGEKREDTLFLDCVAFGATAEKYLAKFGRKGGRVVVNGRLKLEQWDDKATGAKRSKVSLMIETVQVIDYENEGGGGGQRQPAPRPQRQTAAPRPVDYVPPDDDDVPF